jgi:hypothetical protein
MITIELKCEHHREDFLGIVMRVISGEFVSTTAIACYCCSKIAVWIDKDPVIRTAVGKGAGR